MRLSIDLPDDDLAEVQSCRRGTSYKWLWYWD